MECSKRKVRINSGKLARNSTTFILAAVLICVAQFLTATASWGLPVVDGKMEAGEGYNGIFKHIERPSGPRIVTDVWVFDDPIADPNYIYFFAQQDPSLNDNTYGDCISPCWRDRRGGHTFKHLLNSDGMRFQLYDENSTLIFDFFFDYLAKIKSGSTVGFACGYRTGGAGGNPPGVQLTQNDGQLFVGSASWLAMYATGLQYNLNSVVCAIEDSPTCEGATNPNWIIPITYEFKVPRSIFGDAGFGDVEVPDVHNSPECDAEPQIIVCVVEDLNCDGIEDANEVRIGGIEIKDIYNGTTTISTTDSGTGDTRFSPVSTGNHQICVTVPPGYIACVDTCEIVNVSSSSTVVEICFFIKPAVGQIIACKFDDLNCDGNKDQNEPAVEGVTICLVNSSNVTTCQVTGESGCVTFSNLSAGTYTVYEEVPFGQIATTPVEVVVTIDSTETESVTFGNHEGKITVCKFNDEDGDGEQDTSEGPLEGVEITLTGPDLLIQLTTDEDGCVEFGSLGAGSYTVCETVPDGYDPTTDTCVNVVLGIGNCEANVKFGNKLREEGEGTICVLKFNDINHNGIREASDTGVPGVTFVLYGPEGTQQEVTDAEGSACFGPLTFGIYTVCEIVPPLYVPTTDTCVVIALDSTNSGQVIEFGNILGKIINIVWNDLNGDGLRQFGEPPLSNITVNINGLSDYGVSFSTTLATLSDGTALLNGVDPGHYTSCVVVPWGWIPTHEVFPTCQSVHVNGDPTLLDSTTSPTPRPRFPLVQGFLTICKFEDTNGNGIQDGGELGVPGVEFTVTGATTGFLAVVTTESDGCIEVGPLSGDTYTALETVPAGWEATTPISQQATLGRFGNHLKTVTFGNRPIPIP